MFHGPGGGGVSVWGVRDSVGPWFGGEGEGLRWSVVQGDWVRWSMVWDQVQGFRWSMIQWAGRWGQMVNVLGEEGSGDPWNSDGRRSRC